MDRTSRDTLIRRVLPLRTVGAAALVVLLGSCSSAEPRSEASPEPVAESSELTVIQPGEPGEEASTGGPVELPEPGFNHSDIAFVQMMIPHHAQALEMSELAEDRAVDPRVRTLAERIRGAQGPEIIAMSAWLEQKNLDVPSASDDPSEFDHGEHGHDPMVGMLTEEQMDALAGTRGRAFDRLFLEGMIGHHEGAIEMVATVASAGEDLRVAELAADIDVTQRVEIDRMRGLLAR